MYPLAAVYALAFGTAAVACFVGVVRARRIEDAEVRYGLVGLLVGSGGWAASHVGMFVLPGAGPKRASYVVGLVLGFSTVWAWLYFCSAYTGRVYHRSKLLRRAGVAVYLGVVGVKLTNPFHHLYFRAEFVTTPFPRLAIHQGVFHWVVTGFSYALAAVGLFVLFETFLRADYDTRPLGALAVLTVVPVSLDVVGFATPQLIDLIYAPLGVSVFALGVLFAYEDRFLAVKMSGDRDAPTVVLDEDGRIRDYNDAAVGLFSGLPEAEGDHLESVAPPTEEDGVREDGGDGGRIVPVDRGTGTEYYVESRDPISVGQERFGEVVTYTDVTRAERRRRELERTYGELERERDRFANLFEYLPDPVNEVEFVDGEPIVRSVNPAFEDAFGYAAERVRGRNANDVVAPPEDDETDPQAIDRRALEGEVVTEEVRRRTSDGVRDFLFRGIPYRTDGTTRALGVYTDISDQKRRQRRLRVLNRVLRHNVRNEMTVVRGHAELLAEELEGGPLADSAEELLAAATEVTAISEQARAVEKAVRRTGEGAVDLVDAVGSTVERYRESVPGATVEADLPESFPAVNAGGVDIALENLIENAIEHTDGDPTVRVGLDREPPDWAVLRVEDDGPGIPAHERAVVAGDREVTQLEHGSGLGLWVVKWLAEAAGGRVEFGESDLGGACVELRLPVAGDETGPDGGGTPGEE